VFSINERAIRASLCRKSFYEFFKLVWPIIVAEELKRNWHIQYLCMQLQQVAELVFSGQPKKYDLVINVPPGSSKSTIISQAFPAWCWTRMLSFRSINGSHSMDLAMRDSIRTRDIVLSDFWRDHFGAIELRDDENTKGLFTNTAKGGRLAVSVGSKVTGFHGHILTVDDPMDPEESFSEADMKKVNRWMSNTIPSRGLARADTPLIICQQRLAQNDPSGERLARKGRVKHICIPAELVYDKEGKLSVYVNPPQLLKCYRNGLMDPNRLNKQNLQEFHKVLGEYGYAGQYLQDPVPLTGAQFDVAKLKIDEACPRMVRLVRGWDKAACLVAGTLIATARGSIPIESVVSGDLVPTREGWRRVRGAWMSKRVNELCAVVFSNGSSLVGTLDHPVACGNEWIELSKLRPDNTICHLDEQIWLEKSEFLKAQNTFVSRTGSPGAGEDISTILEQRPSTRLFGNQLMGLFPVAIVSTIKTEIGITTRSVIWNAEPNRLIINSTSTARSFGKLCINGIEIRRIVERCLLDLVWQLQSRSILSVKSAEGYLPPEVLRPNIVRASSVIKDCGLKRNGGVPVYDLQIEGCPEFYANGILVHNTPGGGAYSAGVLMGLDKFGDYWVLDVVRGQWNPADRERMIKQTAQLDSKGAHARLIGHGNEGFVNVEIILEKEGGSGGIESTENSIRSLAGFHAIGKRVTGDKEARAYAFASQVGVQDHVHLLNREWTHAYREELRFFPHGKFKDQVDASSLGFNRIAKPKKRVGGGVLGR
jgi:predicted phage terminase large subunit-like protein